jgi:putative transposase
VICPTGMPVAKAIYRAPTLDKAEQALLTLSQKWTDKYSIAVKAWQKNWSELVTFFEFPYEIRRLIYTNNAIECRTSAQVGHERR